MRNLRGGYNEFNSNDFIGGCQMSGLIFLSAIVITLFSFGHRSPLRMWIRARKARKFINNVKRMRDQ
jgi:hypothetical protein